MRAREFILKEIGAATIAPAINLSPETINQIPRIGTVDSTPVYGANFGGQTIVAFIDGESIQAAVIFDQHNNLRGVQNSANIKGAVSSLMLYVLNNLADTLTISKSELMTPAGLKWVCNILQSNRKIFSIVDSEGNVPDPKVLTDAWYKSWDEDFAMNDIELHITAATVHESMFEDVKRLMPIYRIMHSPEFE